MTHKFRSQIEQKFMKDLQNASVDQNNNSDLEDSIGDSYYQSEKKRMEQAVKSLKINRKNNVLDQVKRNQELEDQYMNQYQDEVGELQNIISNKQKNVIQESTLQEIKRKVFNQSRMISVVLADEEMGKQKEKKTKEMKGSISKIDKEEEKKVIEAQNKLHLKIQKARVQRQLMAMARQEEFSKKYETKMLSNFFSERFFQPKIINPIQNKIKINIISASPSQTYSSLKPQANIEQNVLSKNSPQMAMRRIKKVKKIKLVASSTSQTQVKIKKLNPQNPQGIQICQNQQHFNQNQQKIETIFFEYLNSIQEKYEDIKKLSKQFKPKFINEFQTQPEQNYLADNSSNTNKQNKSLSNCLQVLDENGLKLINLTFQNITDIKGIQKYPNVEQIALQYNILTNLSNINSCQKLIQLNISYNKIKSISGLTNLSKLRILNIEHNLIDQIDLQGGALQFLYASFNNIQEIVNITKNRYLKKLSINNNKLHSLQNLKSPKGENQLYYLEQILAEKNFLKNLDGIQNCVMLRILDIKTNRLQQLYTHQNNFIFIFLNKMILSNNNLTKIDSIFLPSLQQLYLDKNRIQGEGTGIVYFPELKVLNLDDNKLTGFSDVYSLIKYSQNLQTIKYDKNTYFLEVREKVRQLYQHIIYTNMNKLSILNQSPYDIGIKKYYEGAYSSYLSSRSALESNSRKLEQIHQKLMFNIKQTKLISQLEESKSKFSETDLFVAHTSIRKSQNLGQIMSFQANMSKSEGFFNARKSIFYEHDQYCKKIKKSIHLIQTLFIARLYRKNKRRRYYLKNAQNIKLKLQAVQRYALQCLLKHCVQSFKQPLYIKNKKTLQQQAALIIQKNYRMYRMRKRYLKAIKKLRRTEQQQQQFPQLNLDFDDIQSFELDLVIPDEYNFDEYIIKPEIFQILQKKQQQRNTKQQQKNIKNDSKHGGGNQMVNNFMDGNNNSSVVMNNNSRRGNNPQSQQQQQQVSQSQQIEKIMRNWNISRQAAQAHLMKQKRKEKLKKIESDKNMSASQRYNKFKNKR